MSQAGIPDSLGAPGKPRSALKQRVLTAVVLVPVLLGAMFLLPGVAWQLLLCLPLVLGSLEWSRLSKYSKAAGYAFSALLLANSLAFVIGFSYTGTLALAEAVATVVLIPALLFWAIAAPLWLYRGWRVTNRFVLGVVGWLILVPAWVGFAFLQRSPWMLLAIVLIIWIADTAAYFAGRRFGRHKLAPLISPGKTWEGVVGAFIAVIVYGFGVSFLVLPQANVYDRIVMLIFVCALTVLGIVGDLFESWIKRSAGAKDSGNLLPGHGGMLDRIDSMTAALPFAALYYLWMLTSS
ncbi:MAG: phosphatidate cytidylyltransferase [Betaproteobacteria bacterium]